MNAQTLRGFCFVLVLFALTMLLALVVAIVRNG